MGNLVEDLVDFAGESCEGAGSLLLLTIIAVPLIPILLLVGFFYVVIKAIIESVLTILYLLGIWEPKEEQIEKVEEENDEQ